jgi:hypothetical protein
MSADHQAIRKSLSVPDWPLLADFVEKLLVEAERYH